MKKLVMTVLAAALSASLSMTAYAGEWKQDGNGWWWQNDDGSYPANCWQWIDANNDQIAECYYLDANGYCLMNTVTPDNCTVNENGAWTVDGVVQTQTVASFDEPIVRTETTTSQTTAVSKSSSGSSKSTASGISSQPYDGYTIIVNTSTKKYHVPGCKSVGDMKNKNFGYADDAGYLESIGYVACKRCH